MAQKKYKYLSQVPESRSSVSNSDLMAKPEERPVFSFEYLQDTSIRKKCTDQMFLYDLLNHLREISKKIWKELQTAGKHSLVGYEMLPVEYFVPKKMPAIVTPEVKKLMVFRASGDNRVMVGIKQEAIFHVLFVETVHGEVSPH